MYFLKYVEDVMVIVNCRLFFIYPTIFSYPDQFLTSFTNYTTYLTFNMKLI